MIDRSRGILLLLVLPLTVLLTGCPDSWQRPVKPPTSALWIADSDVTPTVAQVAQLEDVGLGEMFVVAGSLALDAGGSLTKESLPDLPPSTAVTLVVEGEAPRGEVSDTTLEAVLDNLRQLRFDAEGKGLIPIGFHFDFSRRSAGQPPLEPYADLVSKVRKDLDRTLFLSVTVPRGWLDASKLKDLARAADFIVPFLYGQFPGEKEDPMAWDFAHLEEHLRRLEELDANYMIGFVTLGTATVNGGEVSTEVALSDLMWNRGLDLQPGFSLQGVNRQVYEVEATQRVTVGPFELRKGDEIRVIKSAASHVEELLRLGSAWSFEHHIGQVYFRAPRADETLSLTVDNLINGLDSAPATPDLVLDAQLQRRTGRGYIFRFALVNENGEATELGYLDNNYLQVELDRGFFNKDARLGDFYRYVLYEIGDDGELIQMFRRADVLRLHAPVLGAQQTIRSGNVEIISPSAPEITMWASFILPDGRTLDVGPAIWKNGKLTQPEPASALRNETGDEVEPSDEPVEDDAA
ncbi:MAG: hypothetical protein AAGD38_04745 [Acidobacteriota bacterium]